MMTHLPVIPAWIVSMVGLVHFLLSCLLILGAIVPTSAIDDSKAQPWWAVQSIQDVQPPSTNDRRWGRNEVDQFVLTALHQARLEPSREADKRTLLRRVTIDLTGLPATPSELRDFVNDHSPAAFEKVVDRLLASPRYGERMARRWLDLVHYAESHGHDEDKLRTHAWPYRDYLIRSFNDDKPYTRFIEEQIAGDVLFPFEADGVIALGMLSAGPWDQSSQMGIMDGTIDKQIARYLDRDDMVSTVMSTFTSTTVHCARCHDHKFDPISLDDYYALQAVFAGVDRTNRPFDKDRNVARRRFELTQQLRTAEKSDKNDIRWSDTEARRIVAGWEASQTRWSNVVPITTCSISGATLRVNDDLSISSSGKRPDIDTVFVAANARIKQIAAVRLELLTDPSLPHQGPGRQDNGNLHLTEIKLYTSDADHSVRSRPLKWKRAVSDFDQSGWGVAHAIDGNPKTAWGIYPKVGTPHVAIFELSEPLQLAGNGQFSVALEQNHGAGHLIGRFRLSVAEKLPQLQLATLGNELTAALNTDPSSRSERQHRLLARQANIDQLQLAIKALPTPEMVYSVASHFAPDGNFKPPDGPRPVHVLRRGDVKQPLRPAQPGALRCVSNLTPLFQIKDPHDEGQRRAALAKWIAHQDNPFTWRSLANRLWQWHFGQGLVNTPNDFGKMGSTPSHPALLDWLANQLRQGKSIKTIERLLITSSTYRQSCDVSSEANIRDTDNKWLSHMPRTRLDAETTRDALLHLSGKLDDTMYGPSIKHFTEKPGLHVTPVADYDRFNLDGPGAYRRSIYRFIFRTVPDPLLDSLDCPDGSQLTPQRNAATTPLQALTLLHHPFMVRMSEHLASRLKDAAPDLQGQIKLAFQLALLREPTTIELDAFTKYANAHGMPNMCRILLNTNEFHFLD